MTDIIVIVILTLIIGFASYYIYKSKKNGAKCIGCPYSNSCGKPECTCNKEKDSL